VKHNHRNEPLINYRWTFWSINLRGLFILDTERGILPRFLSIHWGKTTLYLKLKRVERDDGVKWVLVSLDHFD